MEIVRYTPDWKAKWDNFVENSNNGTIFHKQIFFDYHTPGKFSFNHLMILDKGNIKAVLPGRLQSDGMFESPIGASYGSLVTDDIRFAEALDMIDLLIEFGKKEGFKGYSLTAAPDIQVVSSLIHRKIFSKNLPQRQDETSVRPSKKAGWMLR